MDVSFTSTSIPQDNLIAGDKPPARIVEITLVSGESVVRGELLGIITTGGKAAASVAAETDGSEVPRLIAAETIDASAADKVGMAYVRGEFNQDEVTYGAGHSAASVKQALWDVDIFLVDPVTATPT